MDLLDKQLFNSAATELRISNPDWLIDMVRFESGFDPKAKNPYSSARGLIQFIDSTARGMGFKSSLDLVTRYPTLDEQLMGPVIDYLKPYAPFKSEHELYMAVFYPAARKYPATTSFKKIYQDRYGVNYEKRYAAFEKANPGIKSPLDYMNYVKKKPSVQRVMTGGVMIAMSVVAFLMYKKFK